MKYKPGFHGVGKWRISAVLAHSSVLLGSVTPVLTTVVRPEDAGSDAQKGWASFGSRSGRGVIESVDLHTNPQALESGGPWFVVADFEGPERGGRARAWRFASDCVGESQGSWSGPPSSAWTSSMSEQRYQAAVRDVRRRVREGEVYQVNVCRVLEAPLANGDREPDAEALARRLAAGNPAPYAGAIHVPATSGFDPVWVVTASPELFLRVTDGFISSGPIKGTATTVAGLGEKDQAENIMITDLVRNDLQKICHPGSVAVEGLLSVEHHPGLVHLVSTVVGVLDAPPGDRWARILNATTPPASVSGAPKTAALQAIDELEPTRRGPYCGAVGWVDATTGEAELAVGIRTFWWSDGTLRFGTGAGITWGSDPEAEWRETELKARRLVGLASEADCDV